MYTNVTAFLQGVGAFLLTIPMVATFFAEFMQDQTTIDAEVAKQSPVTTAVSEAREADKDSAGEVAEALRQFILVLSPNAVLKGEVKFPVSALRTGDETLYINYLYAIANGVRTLPEESLADAGYQETMLAELSELLEGLDGSAETVPGLIRGSKMATNNLVALFASTDELLVEKLDRLVHGQATLQKMLVDGYDDARAAVHGLGPRTPPRFKGASSYDAPVLVYDRLTVHILQPTLCNRSGRGTVLLYYTGYSITDEPMPGKGVLVNNRERLEQANYDALGPADAPLLLVKQLTLTQAGEYFVVG